MVGSFKNLVGTSHDSYRISLTGITIYHGTTDPSITPPTAQADGFHNGDLYIRTSTGNEGIWQYQSSVWTIFSGGGGGSYTDEQAQDAVGYILTNTGDIAFTYDDPTPSITANVQNSTITNAKLADMAQATIKGRASGAGTGAPTDLSSAQVSTILGLGTAATQNTGTSGANLPFLNGTNTWSGDQTITAALKPGQSFELTGVLSPSQITANQNDYNPTNLSTSSTLRLSTDASRNITGLQTGTTGRTILIHNTGSYQIVLQNESGSSSAANRFSFGRDYIIDAGQSIIINYDGTSSRWRIASSTNPSWYNITYSSTVTPSAYNGYLQYVTMTGSPTIAAPTNFATGDILILLLIQDGTGGRAPSFNSSYKFEFGTIPTPSSTANAIDAMICLVRGDGTFLTKYINNWS